jgi:hypothetical protein
LVENANKQSVVEFHASPKEITQQYPETIFDALSDLVKEIEEDPQLVVDCIIDQLTIHSPTLNNYPGVQANVFR